MAIGWLTVLQSVPWSDVISNAPKVAEGAKKLWNMVGRQSAPPDSSEASTQPAGLSEAQTLSVLSDRTVALEAAVADLHDQMLASSELIKALAEQNAQLIQRIEANRVRVRWIGAAVVTLALAALVGLLLVLR